MASASHWQSAARRLRQGGTIAALTAALMLGACGQALKPGGGDLLSINSPENMAARATRQPPAQPTQAAPQAAQGGISDELLKATDYWGKVYAQSPRELEPALNYARNLRAMGEKRRALAVLQQASLYHGQSRELAGEYGRLALDLDQVNVAKQLLAIADDPGRPDWRVISARGAALAKEGNYNEAIPYFQRALTLAPDQPSVLSNLALAHAMNGEPGKAEQMLRQAAATDSNSPRIRQNLALVLGLQGKYDEAKLVAARDIPMTNATENADYLRQVVKLDPQSVPNSDPAEWTVEAKIAAAPFAPPAAIEEPIVAAVPVEKVADVQGLPPPDPAAAGDTAWIVSTDAPAAANQITVAPKVLSVAEMAKQFAVSEDEATGELPTKTAAQPKQPARKAAADGKSGGWSPLVAQAKR